MRLIFIGPQASGKGTQAKVVSKELGLVHISTGDLCRNASGELKKEIDSYINQGNLFPDEGMIRLLKVRIEEEDCKNGFILDGFPRNLNQANALDEITKIDNVLEIHISDEEAVKRLSGRIGCKNCGEIFNLISKPPKEERLCDNCQSELVVREDDKEEAIRKRLNTYHNETKPILEHYDSIRIDGEQSIEKVSEDVLKVLK